MDIREQFEDQEERIRAMFEGLMREMHVAYPAVVKKDSDGKTVDVQVAIKGKVEKPDGSIEDVEISTLQDAPVHFIGGGADDEGKGGWTLTHPIKEKDEGIAIIASRAIDSWFQQGGVQKRVDDRHHHLSDVMFIPNVRSKPRQLKNISTKTVQLRSDDEGDDKKPKHLIDFDHSNGTIKTSVDSERHVSTIDKENGISHSVEHGQVTVNLTKKGIKSKGTWNHEGGLRATETIQSDLGLKAPQIAAAPGNPTDVGQLS